MTRSEIDRVQDYLRRTFSNDRLAVIAPSRPSAPVEVHIGGEFIGVLHRDEEEGEISYSLLISILEEDLPPAKTVGP